MAFEKRPDGAVIVRMHVPLWTSLFVMVLFFAFGVLFTYGLFFEDTTSVRYRGADLGFSLNPLIWDGLFLLGAAGMLAPGMFILVGLMRGKQPYVRLDQKRFSVRDRAMAGDIEIRWDQIQEVCRFRLQHVPAIQLKDKEGRKHILSAHTFSDRREFEILCRAIEVRIANSAKQRGNW